jgi:hypothetical protein
MIGLSRVRVLVLALCAVVAAALLVLPAVASAESCPNAALRSGLSAALPDCRAYELVTPTAKNGGAILVDTENGLGADGELFGAGLGGGVSPDGESVRLVSGDAFAGAESNPGAVPFALYVARRGVAGWGTVSLDPPASRFMSTPTSGHEDPSTLDGRVVLALRGASQPENSLGLYLLGPSGGPAPMEFGPVLPETAPAGSPSILGEGVVPVGVSADGSHTIFYLDSAAAAHWPFEPAIARNGYGQLLEYVGMGNHEPLPVGIDDGGELVNGCPAQFLGGREHNELGGEQLEHDGWTQNAISMDGEVVFFTEGCQGRQLYARIANGLPGARTIAVSEPVAADCAVCAAEGLNGPASFDGASEDGSKAFFTRASRTGGNVYEYDFNAEAGKHLVDVTAGDGTVSEPAPELRGVVQVSPDGSHVYFVAGGVLTRTKNYAGQEAQSGADNLYLYERDARYSVGRTVFIASLSPQDSENNDGMWAAEPAGLSDVTPDGRFLVFVSHALLTPDDSSGGGQVFEYDAQSNTMTRISIGQDGYSDDGNALGASAQIASPQAYDNLSYVPGAYTGGLTVSGDGSYVFFQDSLALTPQALNGYSNVYEYHDGTVSLISDGQDRDSHDGGGSRLVGTDLSGRDVFFSTLDELLAQDTNTSIDVYDARIDGGFPVPPPPQECSGDACQGLLGAAPVLLSPGSEFQLGGENVAAVSSQLAVAKAKPVECSKGKKLSRGRCVKPKPRKKTRKPSSKRSKS